MSGIGSQVSLKKSDFPSRRNATGRGAFQRELVKPMADLGSFEQSLKGYGCAGIVKNVEYGLVTAELSGATAAISQFCRACSRRW